MDAGAVARAASIALLGAMGGCFGGTSEPVRACEDFLHAFKDNYADRCKEGSPTEARQEGLRRIGLTSCGSADHVRNANELYNVCLPELEGVPCEELASPSKLPSSCVDQFE